MGAQIFAKSALIALIVIIFGYGSFLFTLFVKPPTEILIPITNTYAYMVPKNETDPDSEKILNTNQTLTALYTSFRYILTFY